MRVLVIEEEPETRATIVATLRARGHEVTHCVAAEPALAFHTVTPFPFVVVAWRLSATDGLEVCRRMRQLPGGGSPVILVATDRSEPADLMAGLDAGADDYITKPLSPEDLATRLAIAERVVLERARRELTEDALLSSEASFRALIEGSPDGIITYRRGRIVYANPALLCALGYESGAQLVGREFLDLVHPDDADDASARILSLLHSGEATPAREVKLVTRDGDVIVMEEISIPIEFDGEPAVAAVFRDLTERKHMEQQLVMADRMVSVGTLAAGIAHEINNPLAYVLTNLSFISEELDQVESRIPKTALSAMRELLAQADDGAERVRVIVRDLKTFSRADDTTLNRVDIHAVIEGAINMAWNEIRHRARLRRNYQEIPNTVGSEAKLSQVFLNLLVNAAQSLPVGQADEHTITVSTRHDAEHVHVEFSDTGQGIPTEIQNRVFDPFFTTKPVGVGVGLGLSICHNIVTGAGGDLTFSSEEGRGTTFTVSLPLAKRIHHPVTAAPKPMQGETDARNVRVLIIDDEPSVARALKRSLRNHDVTVVLSGREALKLLEHSEPFDIIFCDLMMSEVTGMDLFEQVRQRSREHASRFVFMTGGAFTEKAREFVAKADRPVIEKPFDIKEVQNLVATRGTRRPDYEHDVA